MVNASMRSTARPSAWAKRRCASVRSFMEPDTSISSSTRRWRGPPAQPRQPHHLAVVPDCFAQAAAQIEGAAAPVDVPAIAAAARQPLGQGAREPAQHLVVTLGTEAARGEHLGGRRGLPGLPGLVRDRWIEAAAVALADANLVILGLRRRRDRRRLAEKMRIEQGVEFRAPLGRRGERRRAPPGGCR